jgi:riboflavin synthase
MFTGLVEGLGCVRSVARAGPGMRLVVEVPDAMPHRGDDGFAIGESIAINGCCLTVVAHDADRVSFDAGQETLSRTNLGRLREGDAVNLERSLRVGDRLGGHFVTGHIDAVGQVDERFDEQVWSTFWFRADRQLTLQMVSKGSVAVDGVSLTLVDVQADRFSVALIPHTLSVTTLGRRRVGDLVNLETDVLAKYAQKLKMPD